MKTRMLLLIPLLIISCDEESSDPIEAKLEFQATVQEEVCTLNPCGERVADWYNFSLFIIGDLEIERVDVAFEDAPVQSLGNLFTDLSDGGQQQVSCWQSFSARPQAVTLHISGKQLQVEIDSNQLDDGDFYVATNGTEITVVGIDTCPVIP